METIVSCKCILGANILMVFVAYHFYGKEFVEGFCNANSESLTPPDPELPITDMTMTCQ